METRELRYFVALAEELHFARAAARVGIEQSPLSKAISRLEQQLGVQLFIRTRRSTTLTFVGETLLKDARRILADVECAHRNVVAAASGRSGRLHIAVCDGVAHPRIAKLLARTREDDPDVDIQIINSPLPNQVRGLQSGAVDVGFGMSASNHQELRSVPLWKDSVVVIMRPDHPLSKQPSIKQIDTDAGPLIVLGERSPVGSEPIETWRLSSVQNNGPTEYVASVELLLTLVAAGYGAGILSAAQAETIRRPDLVVRPLNVRGARITTFMLQRSEGASGLITRFTERARRMA